VVSDRRRKILTFLAAILIAALAIWNGHPLHPPAHAPAGSGAQSAP